MDLQIGDCTIGVEETRATAEEIEKKSQVSYQVTDNDRRVECRERKRRRRRGLVTIAY
jgi:hypothetical protein